MRKRLGAIHSDSTEDYIHTAIKAEGKSQVYYTGIVRTKQHVTSASPVITFDYNSDTTASLNCHPLPVYDHQKIMIIDNPRLTIRQHVHSFCQTLNTDALAGNYCIDFTSLALLNEETNHEKIFKFWIYNPTNTQFQDIIDVYIRSCHSFIYFVTPDTKNQFKQFKLKLNSLKPNRDFTLYKVHLKMPLNYIKSHSLEDMDQELLIKKVYSYTVDEALQEILQLN